MSVGEGMLGEESEVKKFHVPNKHYAWEFTCHACYSVNEETELDSLLLCEGGCRRSFHLRCVALTNFPAGNQKWSCRWCINKVRVCWLCNTYSKAGELVKCSHPCCAKTFHAECLNANGLGLVSGICPFHACGVCGDKVGEEDLYCTKCVAAFHPVCFTGHQRSGRKRSSSVNSDSETTSNPAQGIILGDNFCLCNAHKFTVSSTGSIGRGEISRSFTPGSVVAPIQNDDLPAWPAKRSEISTLRRTPFAVPSYVREQLSVPSVDVSTKSEAKDKSGLQYEKIRGNVWLCPKPLKLPDEEGMCGCKGDCVPGECSNSICFVQCHVKNCSNPKCGNRPFRTRGEGGDGEKCFKVVSAGDKGMGLIASKDIKAGAFIIEYVGEVMTTDQWLDRQAEEEAQKHFYVMELTNEFMADASKKGNESRLINHSCSPNAECLKWVVNGEHRVGIFALKTIPVGEEITYNYRFETLTNKPFKCLCGGARCPGWIGGRLAQTAGQQKKTEQRIGVLENKPVDLLRSWGQGTGGVVSSNRAKVSRGERNADGSKKSERDIEIEEQNEFADKIDWFLTHLIAPLRFVEKYGENRNFALNGRVFFAFLAISVSELEANFARSSRIFLPRNAIRSRHTWGRRFIKVAGETAEKLTEANFLSDDKCLRCRRPGVLLWCRICVRSLHRACIPSGSRLRNEEELTCARCVKHSSKQNWLTRRQKVFHNVIIPWLSGTAKVETRGRKPARLN